MSYFIFPEAVRLLNTPPSAKGDRINQVIRGIESGRLPSPEVLAAAPLLSAFDLLIRGGYVFLTGTVSGHPTIVDGPIVTSIVCAIDINTLIWARTKNRFYRLSGSPGSDINLSLSPGLQSGARELI